MSTTEIRRCVGGRGWVLSWQPCTSFGSHLPDCDRDTCRGCLPRPATHGWLCETCHTRLSGWLAPGRYTHDGLIEPAMDRDGRPMSSLIWAWAWLGINLGAPITVACRDDSDRGGGSGDLPSAVVDRRVSVRRRMEDYIYLHEERARRDVLHERLADAPVFDFLDGVALLYRYLSRIISDEAFAADMFAEVCESMTDAHMICPWRGQDTHVPVPCPNCERKTVSRHAGDDYLTCSTCRTVILRSRFDQWTAMLGGDVA